MLKGGILAVILAAFTGLAVHDDFVYYAELAGSEQPPQQDANASGQGGPSMSAGSDIDGTFTVDCKHVLYDPGGNYWNLSLQARVFDPVGNQIGSSMNSAYKPSLTAWAVGSDSNPEDGTYKCEVDNYAEGQYLGQSLATLTVSFRWPTSLSVAYDQYIRHNFNDYNREIHYQVHDQYQNPLQVGGLQVIETYVEEEDTCSMPVIDTAVTVTNDQGKFRDNYYLQSVDGCTVNSACFARYEQTIKVADRVVRVNEVRYDCYGVTITSR